MADNWKNTIEETLRIVAPKIFERVPFVWDKAREELYYTLWLYFKQSKDFEKGDRKLYKGIMLRGAIGCGKTMAMRAFQHLGGVSSFKIIATTHIVRDLHKDGMGVIDKYGRESFRPGDIGELKRVPVDLCLDDLGLEDTNSKIYGNSANVIADILTDRYEAFIEHGMLTHATTNLNAESLQTIYGARVRNRLKEMVNIINVEGQSLR